MPSEKPDEVGKLDIQQLTEILLLGILLIVISIFLSRRDYNSQFDSVGTRPQLNGLSLSTSTSLNEDPGWLWLDVGIKGLLFSSSESDLTEICITELIIAESGSSYGSAWQQSLMKDDVPKCFGLGSPSLQKSDDGEYYRYSHINFEEDEWWQYQTPEGEDPYSFPYATIDRDFYFQVTFYTRQGEINSSPQTVSPGPGYSYGGVSRSNWKRSETYRSFEDKALVPVRDSRGYTRYEHSGQPLQFLITNVNFRRPLSLLIIYPIVILGLIVLMALLSTAKTLGTFLEGSVAVLLGLVGLRELLIPPDMKPPILVEDILLGIYLFFAIVLFIFIYRTYWSRRSAEADQDVADLGRRNFDNIDTPDLIARGVDDGSNDLKRRSRIKFYLVVAVSTTAIALLQWRLLHQNLRNMFTRFASDR